MRLLEYDNDGFRLTKDLIHDIPRYAILSHTWGLDTEEVTYRDLIDGSGKDKAGYEKIRFCAAQASRDGLRYCWVDTCCIDKSDPNELSKAINSMFRWYQNSTRCYVYLSDISTSGYEEDTQQARAVWESAFRTSRWFTRGWTLQELLAPASVEFFMKDGRRLGDRTSLEQQIHEITGIALLALRGSALNQFSIDERFDWAESRVTYHEEDWAYCLLGIFGVFMPLIYGEGKAHAVHRLRKVVSEIATPIPSADSSISIGPDLADTLASSSDPSRPFRLQQTYNAPNPSIGIWKAAVSTSGNRFVTSDDENIYIWMAKDTNDIQITQTISFCRTITTLSMSSDGGTFAFVSDQTLQLWSYHNETKMFRQDICYNLNMVNISTSAFSLEGELLAVSYSGSGRGNWMFYGLDNRPIGREYGFQVWEVDQSSSQPRWHKLNTVQTWSNILHLGFTSVKERLVCLSSQEIQIWNRIDKANFQLIQTLSGEVYGGLQSFATPPNSGFLAVACSQNMVMWEQDNNEGFRRIPGSSLGGIMETPVSFASDNYRLASCPYSGKEAFIQIWQLKWKADGRWCKEIEQQVYCDKSRVRYLTFLSDGRLISFSRDRVRIWSRG